MTRMYERRPSDRRFFVSGEKYFDKKFFLIRSLKILLTLSISLLICMSKFPDDFGPMETDTSVLYF